MHKLEDRLARIIHKGGINELCSKGRRISFEVWSASNIENWLYHG